MKVTRRISSSVVVEADGDTTAEVFERIAQLEEIFGAVPTCGLCKCDRTTFRVRHDADGNKYYEAVCLACRAEFRFGQRRAPAGDLFPQWKDGSGNVKADGGWTRYEQQAGRATAPTDSCTDAKSKASDLIRAHDYFEKRLNACTDAADLNVLLPDLGGFEGEAKSAAWKLILAFAAKHNLPYDSNVKRFSNPPRSAKS